MYCSTCGAFIPAGRPACDTCGARTGIAQSAAAGRIQPPQTQWPQPPLRVAAVTVCPGCGFRGEGAGYFSRGKHLAGVVGAAMITSWGMGVGGLVYYLLRRDHRICPRCYRSWGARGEFALAASSSDIAPEPSLPISFAEPPRAVTPILLFLFAFICALAGIASGNPGPLIIAALAAGGGLILQRSAENKREERRAQLLTALQPAVLKLAAERNGRLTVTEVATRMGWTLPRAEKVLQSLDDGYRVTSDVTDDGVIVYDFLELRSRIRDGRTELPRPSTGP